MRIQKNTHDGNVFLKANGHYNTFKNLDVLNCLQVPIKPNATVMLAIADADPIHKTFKITSITRTQRLLAIIIRLNMAAYATPATRNGNPKTKTVGSA